MAKARPNQKEKVNGPLRHGIRIRIGQIREAHRTLFAARKQDMSYRIAVALMHVREHSRCENLKKWTSVNGHIVFTIEIFKLHPFLTFSK